MKITPIQVMTEHGVTERAEMDWQERVQIILPDGSSLLLEADHEKGCVYVLGTTSLGCVIPLVEVTGNVHTLPEASIHQITGELVNRHHHTSSVRAVFAGRKRPLPTR